MAQIVLTNQSAAVELNQLHVPDSACFTNQVWMTGGVAVGDFNNDGWPDVFMVGGGGTPGGGGGQPTPDRLFMNTGNGTFVDQAAAWGVNAVHAGNGVSVGDYNDDGWLDIYVTSFGTPGGASQPGKHRLYRNNGNETFTNVAVAAGVHLTTTAIGNGYGSCWGDYDLDGDLDLFVASWRDQTTSNAGTGNKLFRNDGNGTFANVTATALGNAMAGVWGFQGAFVDMNFDGYPELLLSADFETSRYLLNNRDGTFTNITAASGTGLDDAGMGQTIADFNNDGWFDWFVTSIYIDIPSPTFTNGNMLYINQGGDLFAEMASPAGVIDGGWGWGVLAVDLDSDGWMDMLEVNGRGTFQSQWFNEQGYLWRNTSAASGGATVTFAEMAIASGFDHTGEGRALAWLDADRDGDQDFVVLVNGNNLLYYRNDTPQTDSNRWLMLTFDTTQNPRLAPRGLGTIVEAVIDASKLSLLRHHAGNPSYLATSQLAVHFGLGSATVIDELRIRWATGVLTTLFNVPSNQYLNIIAPKPADVTGNGAVNVDDLLMIIGNWGPCANPPPSDGGYCPADIDGDRNVDVDDLLLVINNWS